MKLEMHAHTRQSSRCGHIPAAEGVKMLADAGYDAVVITDHYNEENVEYFSGTYEEKARQWLGGYEAAKAAGESFGIRVFFGLEARLPDCDNDFLIYGAEPNFVLEHPTLHRGTLKELHELCRQAGALLVQAHPNRGDCYFAGAENLDGIEVYNGNPRHGSNNERAVRQAEENPQLIRTAGSDFHQAVDLDCGGIFTEYDVNSSQELAQCLRDGRYSLYYGKNH